MLLQQFFRELKMPQKIASLGLKELLTLMYSYLHLFFVVVVLTLNLTGN